CASSCTRSLRLCVPAHREPRGRRRGDRPGGGSRRPIRSRRPRACAGCAPRRQRRCGVYRGPRCAAASGRRPAARRGSYPLRRAGNRGADRRWARARSARTVSTIAVVAIAVLALAALATLLCLDRQGRDRARFQALDADLLAGFEAVAVAAILDALQRLVDLADQFAFAIARAQLEAEFLFLRGAIVRIGEVRGLILHVGDGAIDFHHQIVLPAEQDLTEVIELGLAHVLLAATRDIRLHIARAGKDIATVVGR